MKKKKLSVPAIVLLALMMMLVTSLAGCTFSVSTASLSEATMCKSVDTQTKRPVEKTDVFIPDTPEIFCSVKVSNAPPDTQITAVWVYIQGEAKDLTNYKINEYALTGSGTRYLSFSLTRPDKGWPIGDYEVRFFIDGQEKLTVPFKVQSASAAPSISGGEAYLSEATMCLSVEPQTKRPIEKANVFSPDTPEIICSVLLVEAPAGTQVTAVLVYLQGEAKGVKNFKIDETTITTDVTLGAGEGKYLSWPYPRSENGFPRGDYMVRLFLNGEEKFQVPFKVQ